MLRTFNAAAPLGAADFDAAVDLCGVDPAMNVFVASRLLEAGRYGIGGVWGVRGDHELRSICWAGANVVPIGADDSALDAYAARLRRRRRRSSSLFGKASAVLGLWERLSRHWGSPRSVRPDQPVLAIGVRPGEAGRAVDPRVRPARLDELDLVLPASAHMFSEEIGYPPFVGSDRDYRRVVGSLISHGHTYVIVEGGKVIFKADIGSLALGVAQVQGVWVAPSHRGRHLASPAMNAVVDRILTEHARLVTLYVNSYNHPARRAYAASGFQQVGTFATVIL